MAFGQYSEDGGRRRTKAGMADYIPDREARPVASVRKAGHNRIHYVREDGSQGFMLHTTEVAALSPCRRFLTLNDGGWATMTTRAAMNGALRAFGIPEDVWSGGCQSHTCMGVSFDRKVTIDLTTGQPVAVVAPDYMLRATAGDGGAMAIEVRIIPRGARFQLEATSMDRLPAPTGKHLMAALECALEQARKARRWCGYDYRDGSPCYDLAVTFIGHDVCPGRFGRTVHVGCHAFKTADVRALYRRLKADFPDAAKEGRKAFLEARREGHLRDLPERRKAA